jgi:hypothetical protein
MAISASADSAFQRLNGLTKEEIVVVEGQSNARAG